MLCQNVGEAEDEATEEANGKFKTKGNPGMIVTSRWWGARNKLPTGHPNNSMETKRETGV